jgi:4-aminobutyrate aminotransferase-like enzyme
VAVAAGGVMRIAPPLCINAGEVDELAQILGDALHDVQDEVSRSAKRAATV